MSELYQAPSNTGAVISAREKKVRLYISRKNAEKADLRRLADISTTTLTKLNKSQPVSLDVLMKFCQLLHCDIGDIVEVIL